MGRVGSENTKFCFRENRLRKLEGDKLESKGIGESDTHKIAHSVIARHSVAAMEIKRFILRWSRTNDNANDGI